MIPSRGRVVQWILLVALLVGCSSPSAPPPPAPATIVAVSPTTAIADTATPFSLALAPTQPHVSSPTPVLVAQIGQRTKTAGCVAVGPLPDAACTPGAIIATATRDQICQPGYSRAIRNVSTAEKDAVYTEYGVMSHPTGAYEVDHLISLELGGSNDIANLWPEPADPRPGFHEKDQVENEFHARMCAGTIVLAEAQREIASNWLTLFAGGVTAPVATPGDSTADTTDATPGQPTATGVSVPSTVASGSGHTYFFSTAAKAYYYCDTDPGWKDLSAANLVHVASEAEAHHANATLTLHRPC